MTHYKKTPNPTAQDKNDTLSNIHKHSYSSVKLDVVPCPKVLEIYYLEEISLLAIHF